MNIDTFKKDLQKCKKDNQVIKLMEKYGIRWSYNDGMEGFDIVFNDTMRIYYNKSRKEYVFQNRQRVKMEYSGIPVFFGI